MSALFRAIYLPPWRIDLTVRDGIAVPVAAASLARSAASALAAAGAPSPASLGVILSDDTELTELNETHMGAAGPTDVLSFPLLPPESFPAGRSAAPAAPPTTPGPPGRRIHLGDIVVSVERAVEQAASGRGGQTGNVSWAASQELLLLLTHGVLHICGWDHASPAEEAAMRAMERRLLD
jgi:probable rRNA maturation factor